MLATSPAFEHVAMTRVNGGPHRVNGLVSNVLSDLAEQSGDGAGKNTVFERIVAQLPAAKRFSPRTALGRCPADGTELKVIGVGDGPVSVQCEGTCTCAEHAARFGVAEEDLAAVYCDDVIRSDHADNEGTAAHAFRRTGDDNDERSAQPPQRSRLLLHQLGGPHPKASETPHIWRPYLPGGAVTVIFGSPFVGKSLVTLALAAIVTAGRRFPDGQLAAQGGVLILSGEDSTQTIAGRLERMRADLSRVRVIAGVRTGDAADAATRRFALTERRDVYELRSVIREGQVDLLILDPISTFVGAIDAWKEHEVRRTLTPLHELAQETGAAVLAVMHPTKSAKADPVDRPQGNIAHVALARSLLMVVRDPGDPDRRSVLMHVATNVEALGPAWGFTHREGAIEFDPAPCRIERHRLLANLDDRSSSTQIALAQQFLAKKLPLGRALLSRPLLREALQHGISASTFHRAAERLGVEHRYTGRPGRSGRWLMTRPRDFKGDGQVKSPASAARKQRESTRRSPEISPPRAPEISGPAAVEPGDGPE